MTLVFWKKRSVHGYSMLRPNLNQEYFYDLYDASMAFGIPIEGHRKFPYIPIFLCLASAIYAFPLLLLPDHIISLPFSPQTPKPVQESLNPLSNTRKLVEWQIMQYCSNYWLKVLGWNMGLCLLLWRNHGVMWVCAKFSASSWFNIISGPTALYWCWGNILFRIAPRMFRPYPRFNP